MRILNLVDTLRRGDLGMVCVVEYGENIGTLRNIFQDLQQATIFAKQLIESADVEYTCITKHKWFCEKKNEYVEIKGL